MQQVIVHLMAEKKQPFILMGLTSQYVDQHAKNGLARNGSVFIDLVSANG